MCRVSVQLDHEPALAPQAVDLELAAAQSDAGIDLGPREAGVLQEAREPILELAPRPARAWSARQGRVDRADASPPKHLGFARGPHDLVVVHHRRQVDQSSRDRGDRYAAHARDLVRQKRRTVHVDAWPGPATARDRDLHARPGSGADPPQGGR
jgi:hypothetical protein